MELRLDFASLWVDAKCIDVDGEED
jgi:hypothetical protein